MVGSRTAAILSTWEAESLPGIRRLRVSACIRRVHPIYWGGIGQYTAVLELGAAEMIGKASVEQTEPLVFTLEECNYGHR